MKILKNLCITMVFSLLITLCINTNADNLTNALLANKTTVPFSYDYVYSKNGSAVSWYHFESFERHPILDIYDHLVTVTEEIRRTGEPSGTPIFSRPYEGGGYVYPLNSSDSTTLLHNQNNEPVITKDDVLTKTSVSKHYNIIEINNAKNGPQSRLYARNTAFMRQLSQPDPYFDYVALNSIFSQVRIYNRNEGASRTHYYQNITLPITGDQSSTTNNRLVMQAFPVIRYTPAPNSPIITSPPPAQDGTIHIWAPYEEKSLSSETLLNSDCSFYINTVSAKAIKQNTGPASATLNYLGFLVDYTNIYIEQYTLNPTQ